MAVPAKEFAYHEFITKKETAVEAGLDYEVEAESILFVLKVLLRDYYAATFTKEGNALTLQFNNGQRFVLIAKEVQ